MIFIDFNFPNSNTSKKWWIVTEISQLLCRNNCTYSETDEIIKALNDFIKQQREESEYNTMDDFISSQKTKYIDHDVIQPMNHFEPYC